MHRGENLQAFSVAHLLIRNDGIEPALREKTAGIADAVCLDQFMLLLPQIGDEDSPHARFVIDHQYPAHCQTLCGPAEPLASAGISIEKHTCAGSLILSMRSPPCARAILRAMARPSPLPPCFVVNSGSKMRVTASSGIGPTGAIKILADPDSSPRTSNANAMPGTKPARDSRFVKDRRKRLVVWAVTFQGTFRILYGTLAALKFSDEKGI